MINKYKVIKNKPKTYNLKNGNQVTIDVSIEAEYTITKFNKPFINVPKYASNPQAIANIVCKLLNNNRKFILKEDLKV